MISFDSEILGLPPPNDRTARPSQTPENPFEPYIALYRYREAARIMMVPNCAQPPTGPGIIFKLAKIPRHSAGAWLYAHCAKSNQRRLIALTPL